MNHKIKKLDYGSMEAATLGSFGITYKSIADATGLRLPQVKYRLKQAGVRTRDYTRGKSELAQLIIVGTKKFTLAGLRHHIQDRLQDEYEKIGFVLDV